jgi:ABC-type Na+ efflux pump permease subunit
MFNYRIMAIIKREVREKLLSRTFIFMTILFPFLMFGGIGIQLALHQDEAVSKIAIVTENAPLTQSFQKEMLTSDIMKSGKLSMLFFYNESSGIKNLSRCKEKGLA